LVYGVSGLERPIPQCITITETSRTYQRLTTIQSILTHLDSLEQNRTEVSTSQANDNGNRNDSTFPTAIQHNPLDDPGVTIIASGIPVTEVEDIKQKAEDLIRALGDDVSSEVHITAVTRLPTRYNNRLGTVKISLRNTGEKVRVLRSRMKLKDTAGYKTVYIRSSKSRIELLIEMNARAVLRNLPQGGSLRVDANGRIKQRNEQQQRQSHQENLNNETHINQTGSSDPQNLDIHVSTSYYSEYEFVAFSCYLAPENSTRGHDAEKLFAQTVYSQRFYVYLK
jgi:hypothetical protein